VQRARIRELCRLGRMREAREVFDVMPHRDIIAWNSMILAYCNSGMPDAARSLATAVSGGNLRTSDRCLMKCPQVMSAWYAMISCYVKNGDISLARRLFDAMLSREVPSWNVMLTGYFHSRQMVDAMNLFEQMPERSLVSWTLMISGYVLIEKHHKAWDIFCMMHHEGMAPEQPNLVSVLSTISHLEF
jgi:pentatricopeptide repeat protein